MRRGRRRAMVLGFGAGLLLAAMAQAQGGEAPDLVAAYFAIWNGGSADDLGDVVTADFRRHAGPGERVESRDELAALIATTRSIYEPFELRIDAHHAGRDGGAARGTFYGVHTEVRRVVEFPVMSVFRMRDGRLSEEWILGDNFLALVGLGYQMTPPGFTITRSAPPGGDGGETTVVVPAVGAVPPPAAVEDAAAPPDASAAEQAIRGYIDVWNSGETEHLAELTSEDFERHSAVAAAGSRTELGEVIRGSREFYRDLRMVVEDVVASGDHGALRARFVGTYGQTKFVVRATSLHMFELRDGRITDEWVQGNTTDLWTSFGYQLAPPDAKITPPPVEVPPEPFPAAAWSEVAQVVAGQEEPDRNRAGTLRIESPVACRIELDGHEIGGLAAGGSAELPVAPGKHRVRALSLGGSQLHDETLHVKRRAAVSVRIEPPALAVLRPRDQTVEVLETGLMWQMRDNGANITLARARATCEKLDQGGHTDWRLPSIHELQSIYRPDAERDGYDTIAGVLLTDCCPWTSTPHGDYHWTYVFHMGMRFLEFEALPWHMRVICVRDPRPAGGGVPNGASPPEPAATWPLTCDFFPPGGPPVDECARRNADGEVVLRPGAWPEGGEATAVRTVVVEGELLFALASGRTAPALRYDNGADYFVEGLARSPRDGKVGFVDERLELVVPRQWDFAFPFEDGYARVCSGCVIRQAGGEHSEVVGGRWGYVDREGRVVVPVVHAREELPAPTGGS